MKTYHIEKSIPIIVTVEAEDEYDALEQSDGIFLQAWNEIDDALDIMTDYDLDHGQAIAADIAYDDINISTEAHDEEVADKDLFLFIAAPQDYHDEETCPDCAAEAEAEALPFFTGHDYEYVCDCGA